MFKWILIYFVSVAFAAILPIDRDLFCHKTMKSQICIKMNWRTHDECMTKPVLVFASANKFCVLYQSKFCIFQNPTKCPGLKIYLKLQVKLILLNLPHSDANFL